MIFSDGVLDRLLLLILVLNERPTRRIQIYLSLQIGEKWTLRLGLSRLRFSNNKMRGGGERKESEKKEIELRDQ